MKYLPAEYILEKTNKYRQRRFANNSGDLVPLDNRYFGKKFLERREPLIRNPCIHWLGGHN